MSEWEHRGVAQAMGRAELEEFTTCAAPMPEPSAEQILADCQRMVRECRALALPSGMRIYREPCIPDWELWRGGPLPAGVALLGIRAYDALLFELHAKPNILELDPGPLDARVS